MGKSAKEPNTQNVAIFDTNSSSEGTAIFRLRLHREQGEPVAEMRKVVGLVSKPAIGLGDQINQSDTTPLSSAHPRP